MSASEKSGKNQFPWTGPHAVPDYPGMAHDAERGETSDPGISEAYGPEAVEVHLDLGELRAVPAPLPEARTAVRVDTGAGDTLWTAVRAHRAVTAGAAAGTVAALALAYALGRRTRRRDLGPVARLLERRF
ncbi:hypothetical protein [Streptomyces sp. NBC_00691]|uniref:hypothetical protein n=1 Tax=Streptomyces sp. NBC_00691 TaxID=2903671 RepID=UPI002E2F67B8|nr:hypothetical protein [Streptomyces sp. NBC_00691]